MRFASGIVYGWPFILLACSFLIYGIARREAWAAGVGAFFSIGPCAYWGLHPRYGQWIAVSIVACNVLAAVAVQRGARVLAAILFAPFLLFYARLLVAVLRQ